MTESYATKDNGAEARVPTPGPDGKIGLITQSQFSEPIVARSVPDEIQHRILSLLSERKLQPGDRLPPERDLASSLRVSRTTLRDALRGLAAKGVLSARPGAGWFVQLDTSTIASAIALQFQLPNLTLDQLLEVRRVFEPVVAYHAAIRRTDDELEQLRTLVSQMEDCAAPGEYLELADQLHRQIAACTHNPFFGMALRPVLDLMGEARRPEPQWSSMESQKEHRELLEAFDEQDGDKAAYAMARHLGGAMVRSWVGR